MEVLILYTILEKWTKNRSKSSLVAQRPSDKNITSNEEITSTNRIASSNEDVNTTIKYSMPESKNNSESFSIQDSKVWRDYIDKSLPTKGTRTYLKDILVQKSSNTDSYTKAQENRQTQTIQSEGNSRKQGVEDSTSFNMNESLKSQNVSEELETGEWTKQKKKKALRVYNKK